MSDSAGTASAARDDGSARRAAARARGVAAAGPAASASASGSAASGSAASGSAASGSSRIDAPRRARRGPLAWLRALAVFYRQVVAELRKVIWPTRKELITYTSVVLVFVVVMVLVVSLFDLAFAKAVLAIFGGSPDATS